MRNKLIELLRNPILIIRGYATIGETRMSIVDAEKIADRLLAEGVIVPPCKVGDKVYQTDGIRIYESTVMEVTYTTNKVVYCTENICFDETAIGKSIFLTREEAEKALAKMQGE